MVRPGSGEFTGFNTAPETVSARRRREAAALALVPDAEEFAYHLTEFELHALLTAWSSGHGWRVADQYAADLAREGLVEALGPYLTAFGMAVRRAAIRERQ